MVRRRQGGIDPGQPRPCLAKDQVKVKAVEAIRAQKTPLQGGNGFVRAVASIRSLSRRGQVEWKRRARCLRCGGDHIRSPYRPTWRRSRSWRNGVFKFRNGEKERIPTVRLGIGAGDKDLRATSAHLSKGTAVSWGSD